MTRNPSAAWTANQVVQAFPWESAPRYLLRARDGIYGNCFRRRVGNLGLEEVIIARRSPWQTPYLERVLTAAPSSAPAYSNRKPATATGGRATDPAWHRLNPNGCGPG